MARSSAAIHVEAGNDNLLLTQRIHCTDLPLDGITVRLVGRTLLLPDE